MKKASGVALVSVLVVVLLFSAVDAAQTESEQPGQLWIVRTELSLTNVADTKMQSARIKMPLLSPSTLYGEVVDEEFSIKTTEEITDDEGNRQGIFILNQLQPEETAVVALEYVIEPERSNSAVVDEIPQETSETPNVQQQIAQKASRITTGLRERDEKFTALLQFTHNHMNYCSDSEWRNGDALQALRRGEGVCEDYASLLVALSGAVGIPSRMVYGYRRSPNSDTWIRHAWMEYFTDDARWVPVDPTFYDETGLKEEADYLAQWYSDYSIRIRHTGGLLRAHLTEDIEIIEVLEDDSKEHPDNPR